MFFGCLPCCGGCETHLEAFGPSAELSVRWGFLHQVYSSGETGDIRYFNSTLPQFNSGLVGPLETPLHTIDTGEHRYVYQAFATIEQSHLRINCSVSANTTSVPGFRGLPNSMLIQLREYACQTYNTSIYNGERTNLDNTLVVQNRAFPVVGGITFWEFVGTDLHGGEVSDNNVGAASATNHEVWYQIPGAYAEESTLTGYPGAFPYSAKVRVRHEDTIFPPFLQGLPRFQTFRTFFEVIIYDVYVTSTGESVGLYHVGPTSPGAIPPTVFVGP